jgi:membrane protein required for colicin V production
VLFCGIVILVGLLAALIRQLMHVVFLGWVDRTFGLIFGTAKGILIASVLFMMLTSFVLSGPTALMNRSITAPYLAQISRTMTVFISKNLRMDFLDRLDKQKPRSDNAQTKEGGSIGIIGPCPGGDQDVTGKKRV